MPSPSSTANAEYQRLHREKLKLKYGENYNRILREKKQKYNQPKYIKSAINEDFNSPIVPFNNEFKIYQGDMTPKNTFNLTDSTIKMYISNLRSFLKLYHKIIPDLIIDELYLYFIRDIKCDFKLINYYFK